MSTKQMGKKRKTRQAKIISQLRRELAQQAVIERPIKPQPRLSQEAKKIEPKSNPFEAKEIKRDESKPQSTDSAFLKRDLIKTLVISVAILSLEIVLYLRLG